MLHSARAEDSKLVNTRAARLLCNVLLCTYMRVALLFEAMRMVRSVVVVHEMVVAGVVWGMGAWLIKVPGSWVGY